VPVDDRTTDVRTQLEWANSRGLLGVGYNGSFYNQNIPTFTWDNPLRYTDSATAGPATGRTALWPTNSMNTFNANGLFKVAPRTRASAAISYGVMDQNETLLPNTSNTALVAPPVERASADAKVDVTSMLFGLTANPWNWVWMNARYRYYDYVNNTPEFTNQVVPGDYGIGAIETSEPMTFNRKTFDLDGAFSPIQILSFNAGYSREDYANKIKALSAQGRIYESTVEDTYRVSLDSVNNRFFTARLKYEHAKRTGSNFDEEMLVEIGEQPGMRHYDIAPRNRDRVIGVFTLTPVPYLDLNATVFNGRDKYPESEMGLQDNKNNGYSFGFDVVTKRVFGFGVNYGHEKYDTLQESRTANPPASDTSVPKQFNDPRRNWTNSIDDKVSTWSAYVNLDRAISRTDIRLGYDLSDGNTNYTYGLAPLTTLATPVQYTIQPENRIEVFKADAQYFVRENIALGFGYWYEHYTTQDFGLDPALMDQGYVASPTGTDVGFFSGYAYEPYKANTVYVRMRYLW
jgi:MtrB/PioB family decaheme-associated outer membrane protein